MEFASLINLTKRAVSFPTTTVGKPSPAPVADPGFQKGGGALMTNFQNNGFWAEFYIKKS